MFQMTKEIVKLILKKFVRRNFTEMQRQKNLVFDFSTSFQDYPSLKLLDSQTR